MGRRSDASTVARNTILVKTGMIDPENIEQAHERIRDHTLQTPLIRSNWLSNACSGEVYLKLENEQHTGSFKARGSLNKLMWLQEQGETSLPVTASTGNHGLGFARALDLLGMEGKIFLPENAEPSKVNAIKDYDTELVFHGNDPYKTELHARKTAQENGWIYVSPYNDKQIIEGQGTIGVEIIEKLSNPDNVLATVGGGGLISGIGSYIKSASPSTKIIGCQPENSPEMALSVRADEYKEVESKPTLSDGSAGGFEKDSITFDLCKKLVDNFILISESEIKQAIIQMLEKHHKLIEGSAGVAVASLLKYPERFQNKTTVIIICGANISIKKLKELL
ncbi:MAG: threonine/serine dehydratase [Balneolaceae bacterium]|nr:threonine/serine dehydratase [Balneolaceae bacterium]